MKTDFDDLDTSFRFTLAELRQRYLAASPADALELARKIDVVELHLERIAEHVLEQDDASA